MKYFILIMMVVLSIFIVGCAKNVPTTNNNLNTPTVADNSQPVGAASDNNMPPSPPPVPTQTPSN